MTESPQSDKLTNLETRIKSGDYGGNFHLFVQQEVYPLIVNDEITSAQFTELVKLYSELNSPYKVIQK